jgi:hypothetical protein
MKTAYTNREGRYPLYIASPSASAAQSGKVEIEVVVVDFGKSLELSARYAGQPAPMKLTSREELWSTWKGTVDTALAYDGDRVVQVSSPIGDDVSACEMRYLVLNGRPEPYRADAPATLKLRVRAIHVANEVLLNGKPLGTIPADAPNETTLSFNIPSDRLAKVNHVTFRAGVRDGGDAGGFNVGPIWLEYGEKRICDLRYAMYQQHQIGGAISASPRSEGGFYFCLP